jgi:hypothetical protein
VLVSRGKDVLALAGSVVRPQIVSPAAFVAEWLDRDDDQANGSP